MLIRENQMSFIHFSALVLYNTHLHMSHIQERGQKSSRQQ